MAKRTYFVGTIKRETGKAILVDFISDINLDNGTEYHSVAWLPKSQIDVYRNFEDCTIWTVPTWLASKNGLSTVTKSIADRVIG